MSGPSRHSCLELQRCFRLEQLISVAGATLLKHQGLILSDFISSGTSAKIRNEKMKRNFVKVSSVLRNQRHVSHFSTFRVLEQVCSTSLAGGGEGQVGPCGTFLTPLTLVVLTSCTGC